MHPSVKKWFEDRNLFYLHQQEKAIQGVFEAWKNTDKVVLAGCPGSGKTAMSIYIAD
jgi:polynucleotide 5'-kinase involved in rRNA processing